MKLFACFTTGVQSSFAGTTQGALAWNVTVTDWFSLSLCVDAGPLFLSWMTPAPSVDVHCFPAEATVETIDVTLQPLGMDTFAEPSS